SRLAARQPRDVLLGALVRHGDDPCLGDLWPCLLQEMALRGARLEGVEPVESYAACLRERGHPLAGLPLRAAGGETDLASALARGGGPGREGGDGAVALPDEPEGDLPVTWEAPEPVACEWMRSVLEGWWGGRVETRTFEASHPIEPPALSAGLVAEL